MRLTHIASMLFAAVVLASCSNPGADCCDCLIDEGCWKAADYACYYYYDEDYSGEQESPPPAQQWDPACQKENCPDCEEVEGFD